MVPATDWSPRASSSRVSGVQPSSTPVTPIEASFSKQCGAMPSPQDLSRGKSDRSSSSTRSAGSACSAASAAVGAGRAGADDDEVPGLGRVIAPRPAWPRPPAPSRSRPGTAPGRARTAPPPPGRRSTTRATTATTVESTGAPTTITTAAVTSTAAATTWLQRAPSRCGRPRTPVAASSARSGSTLTKCAPTPSSAPASGSHSGGTWSALSVSETNAGRPPNATAYGSHDQGVDLSAEVVGPAGGDADQVDRAGEPAARERQRDGRDDREARRRCGRSARTPGRRPAACPRGRPRGRGPGR